MISPLLEIKSLSIAFQSETGAVEALKNISFQVGKGENVAIVGESGSGKTVTSLSVLKLLPHTALVSSGEILFHESGTTKDLASASESEMRKIRGNKISMIFQEPMTSLNPVKTCGSQVSEAIIWHLNVSAGEAYRKTLALFEQVKLPDPVSVFNRYPHEISGGQKQRVMIAMAVSCNPQLLIADEPTTALDVTVQKSIIALLKELQAAFGMSILYITHDLGLVKEIADRVIVMYRGNIIETGTTEDIFNRPKENYTKALLSCHPGPEYKGKLLPVISDFMDDGEKVVARDLSQLTPGKFLPEKEGRVLLRVEDLVVKFPGKKNFLGRAVTEFTAVDHVSFEVKSGETVGLVGESGCGKTTLGRTLLRLQEPSSGRIIFDGKDLVQMPAEKLRTLRKEIQIIFQDPYGSLNPRITIGSAIKEPMAIHGIEKTEKQRKEKAIDLLERVGLKADHFNRYPHEFSGGQRQRICIARAISLNPDFLVCDESVSALDVSVQAQVLNLLTELKNEFGFTSIFISHDLSVVHYISDRIMVMRSGRIVESGTADEIFYNPQQPYTQELIDAIPGRTFLQKRN